MLTRRTALAMFGALASPKSVFAQSDIELEPLIFGPPGARDEAITAILERGSPDMAPALIFAMRFTRMSQIPLELTLAELTGDRDREGWFDWMLWQEAHPEYPAPAAYTELKRDLFLRIDENFVDFLRPEYLTPDRMKIRFEEITWGGAIKDSIPALDNPNMLPATEAGYLDDKDLVFGIEINGDARAYPLRIMGWHEMFNDVIGGIPVALAYCTLCGSGILFETQVPERASPLVFGSSGFLYRSNKLMFDRETHSLWNQFTGRPVVGPLVDSGIELQQRPVAIDTWANWRAANPETTVLSLETGHRRNYGSGVVYREYFASPELMFPTVTDERLHAQKSYVFGIRTFGGAKAWPLMAFDGGRVINDHIVNTPLVLVGDQVTRTVRAYERRDRVFERAKDGSLISDGTAWRMEEAALVSESGARLPRVAGHIAYWFAWNGYLAAESELYEG